jgi:hypothetical protein
MIHTSLMMNKMIENQLHDQQLESNSFICTRKHVWKHHTDMEMRLVKTMTSPQNVMVTRTPLKTLQSVTMILV